MKSIKGLAIVCDWRDLWNLVMILLFSKQPKYPSQIEYADEFESGRRKVNIQFNVLISDPVELTGG